MAIPSGSGSEVLRNAAVNANSGAAAKIDWGGTTGTGSVRSSGNTAGVVAVPANVIITVLNITITATAHNGNVSGTIDWQGSGTDVLIFKHLNLLDDTTFVYNDKIVCREGDILKIYSSAATHISVNFIYQDWT
tara:strand:+ start:200 stop:601 length:402 start_codon:yes stop_codon:yes gene_type:complete